MKKILLIVLLAMIPLAMAVADVTAIEGSTVAVSTLQAGGVYLKTATEEIYLDPTQRNKLIDILKAHAELLGTLSAEKISIKDNRYVGNYKVNSVLSLDFWVYINNYNSLPGVLEIQIKPSRNKLAFDSEKLLAFIKELEATKLQTDTNVSQKIRLDELIKRAKMSLGS